VKSIQKVYLTVHKYVVKRRLGMLVNLYIGTFKHFAITFPRVSQMSPEVTSHVAYKTSENPLGKGWKAYPTAFSIQR
jgi:hypothetical protein